MKLSTIQATLAELGAEPTKSLGQNFLHDQNLAEWIVEQLQIAPGEHLVEIGPGLGALTEFAVPRADSVTLIEKDGKLAGYLKKRFGGPRVEILHQDALEFDTRLLFPKGPVRVLGNLPYYVTSQVLFQFTEEPSPSCKLVFTVQKELAERLAGKPRTKEYGALTLLIGRRWNVKYLRTLPPSVFLPAPKVDSAIIALEPRPSGEIADVDAGRFTTFVKQGFSQRRKQLRKMLGQYTSDWLALTSSLDVPETVRAEELSLEQWVRLTNLLAPPTVSHAQDVHGEIFPVVDEEDRQIGSASRHEVHERGLRHRAVHIFVFNRAGELFLQKRSRHKDRHPGVWDSSAAGHVNDGDGYPDTAAREVQEELGVRAGVEFVTKISACEETGWEFVELYRASHEGPFRLPPAEIETGGFFPVELVREWVKGRPQDFAPGFITCLRAMPEQ